MNRLAPALLAVLCLGTPALAQDTFDLTVATFAPPQHGMSRWIEAWAASLTEESGGRLTFEILHGAQMGPPPRYYDIAANGQADITWVLHGSTPGRFPLTEVSNLPFLFCSAEQATRVLNDPSLRDAYLDEEHRGVRVLAMFMHPPGHFVMNGTDIQSMADVNGLALRPPSQAVGQLIAAMGGRPVGLPPTEIAESLQRGTIDGALIDYGGAALAFQLTPFVTNVIEVNAYAASFALVMNEASFDGLPADLRAMIDASFTDVSAQIGAVWDGMDSVGKGIMAGAGVTISRLPPEALAEMQAVGASLTDAYVTDLATRDLPGAEVLAAILAGIEAAGPVGPGCQ